MILVVKNLPVNAGDISGSSLIRGMEDSLEEEIAKYSSSTAWRIPWMGSLAGYGPWSRKESDMTEVQETKQKNMYMNNIETNIFRTNQKSCM